MNRFLGLSLALGLFAPITAFAAPTIGSVTPVSATAGVSVDLRASVNSSVPIQRCSLWVDLAEIGEMTVSGGFATRAYTFPSGGSRIAFVFCRDTSGGMSAGATTGITVSGAIQVTPPLSVPTPTPTPSPTPSPTVVSPTTTTPTAPTTTTPVITTVSPDSGKLLKTICPQSPASDHPCHAVYYIGRDGKRHAFPNSRVFFTWYGNFNSVEEVAQDRLSSYMLGANVTYRAGVRMVKFTTDPKVYAVARGSVLRWVKTEELARGFYGDDWNKKIDDIPDAFYTNYTFGAEINSLTEYSPTLETANSVE